MEILLIDESTSEKIPSHLEELISSFLKETEEYESPYTEQRPEIMRSDLMVIVLYDLMMESGFTPLNIPNLNFEDLQRDNASYSFNIKRIKAYRNLPRNWRNKNDLMYRFAFVLTPFMQEYQCRFLGICCGDCLIVNVFVDPNDDGLSIDGKSICLRTSDYIVDPGATKFPSKFQNLKNLSNKFKDELATPIRNEILMNEGVLNPSIMGIPDEVKIKLLKSLPPRDLLNISQTCKSMLEICLDQNLWRFILERDFRYNGASEEGSWAVQENWKQLYICRHKMKQKMLRECEMHRKRNEQFDLPLTFSIGDGVPSRPKRLE